MGAATSEDVIRAVADSRDATMVELGGVRSAVSTVTTEVQGLSIRVTALEVRAKKHESLPPPATPELEDLLSEFRRDRAERSARSQIKLETQAFEAEEHVRGQRRRKAILGVLGILFAFAQIAQLVRAMWH